MQPTHLDPWSVQAIRALEQKGLKAGLPLMQRAADCALDFLLKHTNNPQKLIVLVGPGNNGGDALTLALGLWHRGLEAIVIAPCPISPSASDAQQALSNWLAAGQTVLTQWPSDDRGYDLIVDGLFGIGLNRPLSQPWQDLVQQANDHDGPILALDIPSGLMADANNANDDMQHRAIIKAQWTTAFIAPTHAVCDPALTHWVGQCHVCDLGLRPDT